MASKRVEVLDAVKALVQAALPNVTVRGMDADDAKPAAVPALGMVIVRSGDPGTPDIDLSPPTYNYDHTIPVEVAAYQTTEKTAQQVTDEMMTAIGAAIAANRTLGGLVDWLDAEAPTDGETDARGAQSLGWADFTIIATYSTDNPLT